MALTRIGYYLSASKAAKLDWDDFIKLAKYNAIFFLLSASILIILLREEENISVTPITLDSTLEAQGPFDILVHKVTDEIADKDNANMQQKIKYLEVFLFYFYMQQVR